MRNFDERFTVPISKLTMLKGKQLRLLTGAALATATIGKVPVKTDLAFYLGITERELDTLSKAAVEAAWEKSWNLRSLLAEEFDDAPKVQELYYILAAYLISNGIFLEEDRESLEHLQARCFLSQVPLAKISTRAIFDGYIITLEYLWWIARCKDETTTLSSFITMRYGKRSTVNQHIADFCKHVIGDSKYDRPLTFVTGLFKGYLHSFDNGIMRGV